MIHARLRKALARADCVIRFAGDSSAYVDMSVAIGLVAHTTITCTQNDDQMLVHIAARKASNFWFFSADLRPRPDAYR